jgi:hypothetical protein
LGRYEENDFTHTTDRQTDRHKEPNIIPLLR